MKSLIIELYWEATNELQRIKKQKLLLSERVALEKTLAKLDAIKKILSHCTITPNQ